MLYLACEQTLCLRKKIARKGKGRGERACRQTFEAAIPPSCNYLAEHLSVRSLSVNPFRSWVTPGKINGKTAVFCSVSKQSEMDREPNCRFCKKNRWSPVRELIRCLAGWQWPRQRCTSASIWFLKISSCARRKFFRFKLKPELHQLWRIAFWLGKRQPSVFLSIR